MILTTSSISPLTLNLGKTLLGDNNRLPFRRGLLVHIQDSAVNHSAGVEMTWKISRKSILTSESRRQIDWVAGRNLTALAL
jgi:hypothetical protein